MRNHIPKLFYNKFKPTVQKAEAETQRTVLMENNRGLHENQISITLPFQSHCS